MWKRKQGFQLWATTICNLFAPPENSGDWQHESTGSIKTPEVERYFVAPYERRTAQCLPNFIKNRDFFVNSALIFFHEVLWKFLSKAGWKSKAGLSSKLRLTLFSATTCSDRLFSSRLETSSRPQSTFAFSEW